MLNFLPVKNREKNLNLIVSLQCGNFFRVRLVLRACTKKEDISSLHHQPFINQVTVDCKKSKVSIRNKKQPAAVVASNRKKKKEK